MRTAFHPFLPNGLIGDPVLWVDLLDCGRALLLDLGDLHGIAARKLLRVDRVVVTHTHLDHFIGFDHLLRLMLGRERELVLTGPSGFLDNVRGRLAGYTWNLVRDYPLRLRVEEIDGDRLRTACFSGAGDLRAEPLPDRAFEGWLPGGPGYTLRLTSLDHGVPVLGAALCESENLAIDRDRLQRLGLRRGPWLNALKHDLRAGRPGEEPVEVPLVDGGLTRFRRDRLAAELILRRPGQRLAYVTDIAYTRDNVRRVVELAQGAHLLVCEAVFLHEDVHLARERNHLTARQAGWIARDAGVKRLAPFHVSPRYQTREQELLDEAAAAFEGPVIRLPTGGEDARTSPEGPSPVL